jgi:hypothetical protein
MKLSSINWWMALVCFWMASHAAALPILDGCSCWIFHAALQTKAPTRTLLQIRNKCGYIDRSAQEAAQVILGRATLAESTTLVNRAALATSSAFPPFRLYGENPHRSLREAMFAMLELGVQRQLDRGIRPRNLPASDYFRSGIPAPESGLAVVLHPQGSNQNEISKVSARLGLPTLVFTGVQPLAPELRDQADVIRFIGNPGATSLATSEKTRTSTFHLIGGTSHWSTNPNEPEEYQIDLLPDDHEVFLRMLDRNLQSVPETTVFVHTTTRELTHPNYDFTPGMTLDRWIANKSPAVARDILRMAAQELFFHRTDMTEDSPWFDEEEGSVATVKVEINLQNTYPGSVGPIFDLYRIRDPNSLGFLRTPQRVRVIFLRN